MLPAHTAIDVGDNRLAYSILPSELALRGSVFAQLQNVFDLGIRQLCIAMSVTYGHAPFFYRVVQILFCGSKKQVRRVTTRPKVAPMANVHSFWDWAMCQLVGNARSGCEFSFKKAASAILIPFCALPRPTCRFGSNTDLYPKPFLNGKALWPGPTALGAALSGFNVRFPCPLWHGLTYR